MRTFLVILLVLAASPAPAVDFAKIGKLVEPLIEADAMVGCVVGIIDGDKQEVRGYGSIHRGMNDKPTGDTIYEIGSVTKAFTGTLLAEMAKRGEVKLDTPLQDLLPPGVKLQLLQDKPIRLVDVASQTSGLPRLPDNFAPADKSNPYADFNAERLFEFLRNYKLTRAPGTYEYSNLGMGMLGYLLATKVGKSYEELLVDRIAGPLKMTDTRIKLSDEQLKRLAPGHNGELEPVKNWDLNVLAGAGGIRSTANDLMKFAKAALADDKTPVVEAIQEAWKPRYGKQGEIGTGLGWHIARDGVTRFHNGQTGGYTAAVFLFKPKKMGVVVVCNTATDKTDILAERIIQTMFGMSPPPIDVRKVVKVAPEVLKQYEGVYALSLFFGITVTVENGKLMAQATGQDKVQIYPESESKFFYKVVDAQIEFTKGKDGQVDKLVLHQNGQSLPGVKVPPVKK